MNTHALIAFIAYLVLLAFITLRSARDESAPEFMIGARRVGVWGLVASLAAGFRDGAGLAVWISLAIFFGFGTLWLTTGMAIALVLLAVLSRRVSSRAHQEGLVTVGDALVRDIGPVTARLTSFVVIGTAFLYAAAQLFVSGRILAEFLAIPAFAGVWLVAGVVGAYLVAGGFKTVIKTDVLQWAFILLVLVLPFALTGGSLSSLDLGSLLSPGWRLGVGFFGISFFVVFSSADVWQRIYAATTGRVAGQALLLTIPAYYLISIGIVLLGLFVVPLLGDVAPEDAFFAIFSADLGHPILISLLGVFAAASVMSTLDTQVFLLSSTVTRDLLKAGDEAEKFVKPSRYVILLALALMAMIASTIANIIEFLFSAVTLGTILFPVLVFSAVAPSAPANLRRDRLVAGALGIAVIVYVVLFARGAFEDVLLTLVPPILASILVGAALFLTPVSVPKGPTTT